MADDFDPDAFIQNFDPDAFIQNAGGGDTAPAQAQAPQAQQSGFDPDQFIANFDPDAFLKKAQGGEAEGLTASIAREAANDIVPATVGAGTGYLGGMAGGALAGMATANPIGVAAGAIVGGLLGGMGGGYVAGQAQQKVKEAVGLDDSAQRALNSEAHPVATGLTDVATNVATMRFDRSAPAVARVAGGALMGGVEGGRQAVEGKFDPVRLAATTAAGAVFTAPNSAGQAMNTLLDKGVTATVNAGRRVAGRPNAQANPVAAPVQQEAKTSQTPTTTGETSFQQPPPPDTAQVAPTTPTEDPRGGATINVVGSSRDGGKESTPSEQGSVTTGALAPDVQAAITTPEKEFKAMFGPEEEQLPKDTGIVPAAEQAQQKAAQVEQASAAQPPSTEGMQAPQPTQEKPATPARDPNKLWTASEVQKEGKLPFAQAAAEAERRNTELKAASAPKTEEAPSATEPAKSDVEGPPKQLFGFDFLLDTRKGKVHKFKDTEHETVMPYDRGRLKGTKGADGEAVDANYVGTGDKHFVIDQRNPETGKFDEHKIMANAKDATDAMEHYSKGFSDERGGDRIASIREASEKEIADWVKNGDKSQPFDENLRQGAPTAEPEPKIITAAVKKMKAAGLTDEQVAKFRAMPADEKMKVAAQYVNVNKRGQARDTVREDRVINTDRTPIEGLTSSEGTPINARDKADAAGKAANLKTVSDAFEKHAPEGEIKLPETPEERVALFTRVKAFVDAADKAEYKAKGSKSVYVPAHKPASYLLLRSARQLVAKPTAANLRRFIADEKILRSGDEDAIDVLRKGNRVEADIARNKRGGEENIAGAEAQRAVENPGDVEDAMIAALDAKREFKGDIPHEEAETMVKPEPVETAADVKRTSPKIGKVDLTEPEGKKQFNETVDAVKPTTKKVTVEKPPIGESEGAASAGKKIDVKTLPKEYLDSLIQKASAPKQSFDRLSSAEIVKQAKESTSPVTKHLKDLWDDQNGALDFSKIWDGIKALMQKRKDLRNWFNKAFPREDLKTYRARDPKTPAEEYAYSLSDVLHKNGQEDIQHILDLQKIAKTLTDKDGPYADPKARERAYNAIEENKTNYLTPAEEQAYNANIKPLQDANQVMFDKIKDIAQKFGLKKVESLLGPAVKEGYIYRMAKGEGNKYDIYNKGNVDPVEGFKAVQTSPTNNMLARRFYVMEQDGSGKRVVISPAKPGDDQGFNVWINRKPFKVDDPNFKFEEGEKYKVGSRTYTMKQALTHEIEQHALFDDGTPAQYHHDAVLSMLSANYFLGRTLRHLEMVGNLKDEMEKTGWAVGPGKSLDTHYKLPNGQTIDTTGYKKTDLKNFDDWYVEPRIARELDHYAQPGVDHDLINWARGISQAVTKTMFWNPVPHARNVGEHWVVERGFRWITPSGIHSLAVDGAKAIKSVVTQDELQRDLRRAGAGTIYGGVLGQNFLNNLVKDLTKDIRANKAQWDIIAKKFGYGPSDLIRAVYRGSQKAMWAANDVFLTQSILEHERNGLTREQAIRAAERHIPNYRIPAEILGSAKLSQFAAEPTLNTFGRYHYGVWNSYANMTKDIVKGNPRAKLEAVGNLMVLGALAFGGYGALDKFSQWVLGNDKGEAQRRGPVSIPHHLARAAEGKEDVSAAARSTFTGPPLATTLAEEMLNRDWRGKNIREPGASTLGKIGQTAGHITGGLVAPYSTVRNSLNRKEDVGYGVMKQLLDVKEPSQKGVAYEAKRPAKDMKDALRRERTSADPLEQLGYKLNRTLTGGGP